jgi:uncharacterized protein (DUF952 family)
MLVYKILRRSEWDALQAVGTTLGAPIDVADGYVHLSSGDQVVETAARHFAGEDDLLLLSLDDGPLGDDLRWEPSRGGALFPHLYRELRTTDIVEAQPLPLVGDRHRFPELPGTPP